ncbi:MAG: hypothetical protein ACLQDY_22460 [Streptosporangiaceae bacterium]
MTEARTMGRELQDEVLSTVRNSQNAVVEAIQAWTSKVQSITPELTMPFADKMPKPHQLVADAYDFAERMLASQRKFAEDVLKATAPWTGAKNDAPAKSNGAVAK